MCRELNRTQHDTEALGGEIRVPHGLGLLCWQSTLGARGAEVRWFVRAYHECRWRLHGVLNAAPPGLLLSCCMLRVRSTVSAPHQGGEDLKRPRTSSSGGGQPPGIR